VHFLNGLSQHVNLTVCFERQLGSYQKKQYESNPAFHFKSLAIGGLTLGKENHFSLGLINHLKKHKYDLVVMNGYASLTEMVTIHYLIQHQIPYTLYVNGGFAKKDAFIKRHLKRYLISHAQHWVAPSAYVNAYLLHYGARLEQIYYYPYATFYDRYILAKPLTSEEKLSLRNSLALPPGKIMISVSQFIARKNLQLLLNIWQSRAKHETLMIIGEGPLKTKYAKWIRFKKMTNIKLLPFQSPEQLKKYYQCSDAFILLSKEDIYGHVINEAMSQGLPVIASSTMISAQTLINKNNGFILDLSLLNDFDTYIDRIYDMNAYHYSTQSARLNTYETMIKAHVDMLKQWGIL
jgi:glycosyltransferase involved in cell wall biosynthesis